MARFVLLPRDCRSRALYLEGVKLPVNYMEDFTIMGFLVDGYEKALSLLQEAGYSLNIIGNGAEIHIDRVESLPKLSALFAKNNIGFDWTDIADTVYQA